MNVLVFNSLLTVPVVKYMLFNGIKVLLFDLKFQVHSSNKPSFFNEMVTVLIKSWERLFCPYLFLAEGKVGE